MPGSYIRSLSIRSLPMRRLILWMPFVFVGSLTYWSLAMSLCGMSFWSLRPTPESIERDFYQPLTVNVIEEPAHADEGDWRPVDLSEPTSETPPTLGPPQGPGDTAF